MGRLSDYINRMNEKTRTVKMNQKEKPKPACTEDLIIHLGLPTKVERRLLGSYGSVPMECFKWWLQNGDVARTTRGIGAARVQQMLNQLKNVEAIPPAQYVRDHPNRKLAEMEPSAPHDMGEEPKDDEPPAATESPQEGRSSGKGTSKGSRAEAPGQAAGSSEQPETPDAGDDLMQRAAAVMGAALSIVDKYNEATQGLVDALKDTRRLLEARNHLEADVIDKLSTLSTELSGAVGYLLDLKQDAHRAEQPKADSPRPQAPNPAQPQVGEDPVDAEPVPETYQPPPTEAAPVKLGDEPHVDDPVPGPDQQKQYRVQLWEDAQEMGWKGSAVKMMAAQHGKGQNAMKLTQGTWDAIFQDLHDPEKRDYYNRHAEPSR